MNKFLARWKLLKLVQEETNNWRRSALIKEIVFVVQTFPLIKLQRWMVTLMIFIKHLRNKRYQSHTNSPRKLSRKDSLPAYPVRLELSQYFNTVKLGNGETGFQYYSWITQC